MGSIELYRSMAAQTGGLDRRPRRRKRPGNICLIFSPKPITSQKEQKANKEKTKEESMIHNLDTVA